MKELELNKQSKIEISVKQKKEVKHDLIGKIIPENGHSIFKINKETLQIELAKFSNITYHFSGDDKKEIITENEFVYISALNKKNALKKFKKEDNGSVKILEKLYSL
jgi:hypothetical protein